MGSVVVDSIPTRHLPVKPDKTTNLKMKQFIALTALAATALAAPAADPTGPIHPAHGDLVATKRGFRPLSLEGFSEDDDQDGFVDPIGQVAPVVYAHAPALAAPLLHHAPLTYAAPLVKKVEVEAPKLEKLELPAVTYAAAPAFAPYLHHAAVAPALTTYTHTVPVSQTYTHTVPLGVQRRVVTTHHVAGHPAALTLLPGVVAAAEAKEE